MDDEDDCNGDAISPSHFRPEMRKRLQSPAQQLSKSLESGKFEETYDAFYRLLRPVAFDLIMKVPDKSRLDIPVDLGALSAFLHELTVILFADLEPWNSLSRLKGTFITFLR